MNQAGTGGTSSPLVMGQCHRLHCDTGYYPPRYNYYRRTRTVLGDVMRVFIRLSVDSYPIMIRFTARKDQYAPQRPVYCPILILKSQGQRSTLRHENAEIVFGYNSAACSDSLLIDLIWSRDLIWLSTSFHKCSDTKSVVQHNTHTLPVRRNGNIWLFTRSKSDQLGDGQPPWQP